ncbi:Uma2 family endonuclease [Embleya sp. NPDC059237]|uniref:Uma2 family endonuclease n=1 Tax=Embleya sp. NPDC059237 TaxID=3346784 RepID=UPI0036CC437D
MILSWQGPTNCHGFANLQLHACSLILCWEISLRYWWIPAFDPRRPLTDEWNPTRSDTPSRTSTIVAGLIDNAGRTPVRSRPSLPWSSIEPEGGWTAQDLDRLPPGAPPRVELLDGMLVVRSPQSLHHSEMVGHLFRSLDAQAPAALTVVRRMTVRVGPRSRPEADVLVVRTDSTTNPDPTMFQPADVRLVVEVVSPDTLARDRGIKPALYARSGIPYFWRVEQDMGDPTVHVHRLDPATRTYVPTGVHRAAVKLDVPFTVVVNVAALAH